MDGRGGAKLACVGYFLGRVFEFGGPGAKKLRRHPLCGRRHAALPGLYGERVDNFLRCACTAPAGGRADVFLEAGAVEEEEFEVDGVHVMQLRVLGQCGVVAAAEEGDKGTQ